MRFLVLCILMLFPLLDLIVTARFARLSCLPMWMCLAASSLSAQSTT